MDIDLFFADLTDILSKPEMQNMDLYGLVKLQKDLTNR